MSYDDPPYLVDYNGMNHPHKWKASEEMKVRKSKDLSDKYSDVDDAKLHTLIVAISK